MMEHVPQPKLCVMMPLTAEWRWYHPALFLQLKPLLFKYGANMYVNIACDISAIVNESFIFTIVLMSRIPYLLTHLHHIELIENTL